MRLPRPKGPSLKAPAVKPPAFLTDLYYDLRDRRLLPLVGLVVVAIVAVPFLLGDSPEEFEPAEGGVIAALESSRDRSSLTVVEAKPGLRDYRDRLRGRTPTDPFVQRYTSSSLKGAKLNEQKDGGGGSGEKTSKSTTDGSAGGGSLPAPSTGGGAPSNPAPPPSGKGGSASPGLTFFTYAINVRIVKNKDGEKQDPVVRKRVLPQTALPGAKAPIVTYMGAGRKGKTNKITGNALLLVSEGVTAIAGDAKCLSGDEVCQLLEVEPGFPVVLTYGEAGVKYTVNVLKLGLVVTGHSKR